ncbi:MAG: hypothetical protein ACK40U_09945, partial [Fervidobacterium pennivorans]
IMNADQIIVLKDGKIVGIGSHSEPMKTNEIYREIVYSQLSKEEAIWQKARGEKDERRKKNGTTNKTCCKR